MLVLLVNGSHLLGEARKSVTNQVTTPPDSYGQHRIHPDTACGLTCGCRTCCYRGGRNRPACQPDCPGLVLASEDVSAESAWSGRGPSSLVSVAGVTLSGPAVGL